MSATFEFKYESIPKNELDQIYQAIKFKGFDRNELANKFVQKYGLKVCQEIAVIVAVRGPVKSLDLPVKFAGNKTIRQLGISHSARGDSASPSRICACFADYAAFVLKEINIPKRLNLPCPAWLQFPAAGGIKMPARYRALHREFSEKFSEQIGGSFQESIYSNQEANEFCSDSIKLFN